MAKITLDLNRFKASGVYTVEFDSSERIVVSTQTIRLVVGFSRKGPFNAPVFLRDVATCRKVFGTVDSFLEKKGSFFHRALETCLQTAPVFGLNLLPLNNVPVSEGGDAVDYRSFALAANEQNGNVTRALLSSFYNKERFWFPDESYLQATVDSKPANKCRLFNFVNLGQQVQSVIVIKSSNASLYNVTAEDYYGRGEVPAFINPLDYLSDYFVDVYVVKGNWTDLTALSQDPLWSKYFDLRGVKADKFFEFLSLDGVTMTGSFTGSIIPDFVDNNGSNQSIDTIVNNAVAITGIFCNLNKQEFDDYANSIYKVDPVGNTLINTTDDLIDFLSYNTPIKSILELVGLKAPIIDANGVVFAENGLEATIQDFDSSVSPEIYVKSYPYGDERGKFNNVLVIPKPYPSDTVFTVAMYENLSAILTNESLIKTFGYETMTASPRANDFVKIAGIVDTGDSLQIQLSTPLHTDTNYQNASGDAPESNYILTSKAYAVPSAQDTIAIVAPTTGDAVATIDTGTIAQSTPHGQPIQTGSFTAQLSQSASTLVVSAAIPGKIISATGYTVGAGSNGAGWTCSISIDASGNLVGGTTTAGGDGWQVGDTIIIPFSSLSPQATAGSITLQVDALVPTTYANAPSSGGSGSGATFDVDYDSVGNLSVTLVNGGVGYQAGDTLTIGANNVGGGAATNITFDVLTVTTGPSIAQDCILLIEAPGYAKYFEIDAYNVAGSIGTITVKNTALTTGGPFYQSKYCVEGFPADEFASYIQPSDINVTIFDVAGTPSSYLVPDLTLGSGASNEGVGYLSSVDLLYSKIDGLSQTAVSEDLDGYNAVENQVTLDYWNTAVTPNAWTNIAPPSGTTWHILAENETYPAYDINLTSATFGSVRITNDNTNDANPFAALSVSDTIRVTIPGGQVFYGDVADTNATVQTGIYNLSASTNTTYSASIPSLALYEAYPGNKVAKNIKGNLMVDGDRVKYSGSSSAFNYLNVTSNWGVEKDAYSLIQYGLKGAKVKQYTTSALLTPADATFVDLNETYNGSTKYDDSLATTNDLAVYSSLAKNISQQIDIIAPGLYGGGKKFSLTSANAANLEIGDYVVNNDVANPLLVRVTAKVKKLDTVTGLPYYEYTVLQTPAVDVSTGVYKITKFAPIQKFCDRYQFTRLSGFALTDFHLPGTPAQLEKIYGVLENTNLAVTLADKDVISFRYIVDTFNGGLEPHMGPKQILSRLAKNRQKCLALLNAPSIAEFQASTDPRFTELPDPAAGNPKPVLNTAYIETGGNLSLGPSYTWGLPDEDQGAKFIGVFSPNIIIRENNKDVSVPPAADVSNNFIRKFINSEPYGIVAGPRRGVISNPKFARMEYDYLLRDREHLEPIGINPIVVVKNVGPMIFANQTAYQRTLSAFNNLHVRDLLITIEEGIEEILQNYLFEFNDATTRLEIRSVVETYLDVVRNNGGIYDYAVIMDETNNTPAIIDQNFGILDVGIEPARGIQKFINRVTILKTGTISSGGFTAA